MLAWVTLIVLTICCGLTDNVELYHTTDSRVIVSSVPPMLQLACDDGLQRLELDLRRVDNAADHSSQLHDGMPASRAVLRKQRWQCWVTRTSNDEHLATTHTALPLLDVRRRSSVTR